MRPTDDLVEWWLKLKSRMENGEAHPKYVLASWQTVYSNMLITQEEVDHAAQMVQLACERDAIQAERPEGCWCLGLGGRGTAVIPRMAYFDAEDVFSEFCDCPEGQAERQRVKSVREERMVIARNIRLDRHWENCGIPKRFRDLRLETSPLRETMPELVQRMMPPVYPNRDSNADDSAYEAWLEADSEWRRSWFLWGDYGTGKTGLAVGYAWEYLNDGEDPVMFRSLPDLLAELRATYNRPRRKKNYGDDDEEEQDTEAALIERLSTVSLLILDDLGAEQVKETGDGSWVADRLFQIIGKRHAEELTTVFTSNLNLEQVAARIGERLTWRIVEMCGRDHIIHVTGKNLRA